MTLTFCARNGTTLAGRKEVEIEFQETRQNGLKDGVRPVIFERTIQIGPVMSSQGFSFPPPPPPPPRQQQPPQQHNHAPQYGQNHRGQRGGRGAGGNPRGRGRGQGNRGGGRGGHYTAPSPAYSGNAAPSSVGYAPMNYAGFPTQPLSTTPTPAIAAPQYGSNYPPTSTTFTSPQTFSQPTTSPYQHQATSYDAYNQAMGQMAQAYAAMPYQHASPPMPWSYGQTAPTGAFPGAQQGNGWGPPPFNSNAYGNNMSNGDKSMKQHNKRDHSSAFGKPQSTAPRVPAPPPVPSFGNPLPSKPPPPSDVTRKPKKKRKHNQLGLTPKAEDHESSEEDDDVDEESKLASGGGGAVNATLRFTYRGRTATLKTPEDIAAWIEERKKRFPTQARAEERKKAMEEAKKARDEAMKQKREARQQETKQPQKDTPERRQQRTSGHSVDAVAKAKEKADKLSRKLEREQKRVAKAEADAERARLKVEELRKESTGLRKDGDVSQEAQLSATSAEHFSGEPGKPVADMEAAETNPSSDTPDDSDWTSSSGSDLSDSEESDDEDVDGDDSAPEELTSRREGPERVPPPPRTDVKKRVCRHFARNGRCLRGDSCNFLHELPERKAKTKPTAPQQKEKSRKGLLHMVSAIGTLHRIIIRKLSLINWSQLAT